MKSSFSGIFFVSLATIIWGLSGVAQSVGNDYMGVFTFNTTRSIIGTICLIPIAFISVKASEKKIDRRALITGGILAGVSLWFGLTIQQYCLTKLMVGKVIFLTSLYVIMVPVLNWPHAGNPGRRFGVALVLVLAGLYLLCLKGGHFDFSPPEILMLGCAFANAILILVIDRYITKVDCFALTAVEFATIAVMSLPAMLIFDKPALSQIIAGWKPVLYAGVMSSAAGYSCQALGQRNCEPAIASLLLSLETVYAIIGAWLLLGQAMTLNEIIGCSLMFAGTVVAEVPVERFLQHKRA